MTVIFKPNDKVQLKHTTEVRSIIGAINNRKVYYDRIYVVEKMHPTYHSDVILKEVGSFFAHFFELAQPKKTVGFIIDDD